MNNQVSPPKMNKKKQREALLAVRFISGFLGSLHNVIVESEHLVQDLAEGKRNMQQVKYLILNSVIQEFGMQEFEVKLKDHYKNNLKLT